MVVAVVALGRFVTSVPVRYDHLAHPTVVVRDALAELGLSPAGYALYNVALDAVFVLGLAGRDNLLGGTGKDVVNGGSLARPFGGDKNLVGGPGNDAVQGGSDSDNVVGGDGNDYLVDGEFENAVKDNLSGGTGNDMLDAINKTGAKKDVVACGSGFDRVIADGKDLVAPDCEKVTVGLRNFDTFYESIPESFWEGLPQF